MGECFLHGNNAPVAGIPVFTYTGEHLVTDEGNKNWNIQLLTSGVMKPSQLRGAAKGVEVFLVGSGNSGNNGHAGGGGSGGDGGETKTVNVTLSYGVEYQITIGAGGEATTGFGHTANAGGGSPGGGGGSGGLEPSPNGKDGSAGTHAFGDTSYARYGAGGGGGCGTWDGAYGSVGSGGDYGGGNGGGNNANGKDGIANTGGGGGGGGWSGGKGGSGGSGIVIIRNKRS